MSNQKILVVGDVFVDTHLDLKCSEGPLVRLGGIFHSARGFDSLDIDYALAYYAPNYLEEDINKFSFQLNAKGCYRIGRINRAPNIMLISESTEVGDQGYYNLLRDQTEYIEQQSIRAVIDIVNPTDILIYPGKYNVKKILDDLKDFDIKIHIDLHYDSEFLNESIDVKVTTIILSTSSFFFKKVCNGTMEGLIKRFEGLIVHKFLLKENRGGSLCYLSRENASIEAGSWYVPKIMHSVGVGDVYNSIFISELFDGDIKKQMKLASICAAKYAETMCHERYVESVKVVFHRFDEFESMKGIRLPWTERKAINLYIAAPDFPNVDTTMLEKLKDCLIYHNFSPRLPIRENGLVCKAMEYGEELAIYQKDMELLDECRVMIAVFLCNDPGMMVELGMYKQQGKPTIVFDPFGKCENMFVRHTPDYLCITIEDVIAAVYLCAGRRE